MKDKVSGKWLSVAELSRRARIPESTTRRYLTRFEMFFRMEERSRGRRYHPDAVVILTRIQSLYAAGAESDEINRILSEEYPIIMSVDVEKKEQPPPPIPPYATHEDIQKIYLALEALREENLRLRKLIESEHEENRRKVLQLEEELKKKEQELDELRNKKKPWWKIF